MRSWSKWNSFSRKWKSSSSVGPRMPALSEFWSSAMGTPWLVVSTGVLPLAVWWTSPPAPRVIFCSPSCATSASRRLAMGPLSVAGSHPSRLHCTGATDG
jgi:hypothetical protein